MARHRTAENNLFVSKAEERMRLDSVRAEAADRLRALDGIPLNYRFVAREERAAGGWREISIRDRGRVVAVVTRPCSGAKWFLQWTGRLDTRGVPFPTRKAALAAAMGA
jgi:hypothetical protein